MSSINSIESNNLNFEMNSHVKGNDDTRNKKNWRMDALHSKSVKDKVRIFYAKEKREMQKEEFLNEKQKDARSKSLQIENEKELEENSRKRPIKNKNTKIQTSS